MTGALTRSARHARIAELIAGQPITSQTQLARLLGSPASRSPRRRCPGTWRSWARSSCAAPTAHRPPTCCRRRTRRCARRSPPPGG
ncbi:hypothetical protein ACFQX8_06735 [Klenkia terrae]|uniref:hypothetical protein n=1 Tax=Klenkia terrae TaxID=1052259 RepID=UPI00361DC284